MDIAYIQFDDGDRRTFRSNPDNRVNEAICACDSLQQEADLLDSSLNVVARVRRTPGAMNGFSAFKVST